MGVSSNDLARQKYKKAKSSFLRRGITFAIASGICYSLYSAFLTVGEYWGVWSGWWVFPLVCTAVGYTLLCAVGAGLNDFCSGLWCLLIAAFKGKAGDYFRSLGTKPGTVMMCCGIIGGPIATTAYSVGLMTAGGIVAPISALCSAIGAIIGRVVFKQELNLRMICGILICFAAAVVIGGTAFLSEGTTFVGCLVALVSAIGWGIEGAVAGFGTSMLDYEIGITLRQTTSGIVNLFILIPILCLIAGAMTINVDQAFLDSFAGAGGDPSLYQVGDTIPLLDGVKGNPYIYFVGGAIGTVGILWFVVSGFFANPAYSFWYKGNSMCGAALGMTCNAMYSFWVPLALFIVFSILTAVAPDQCAEYGIAPTALTPIQWIMAVVEVFGIWLIAMNPLDLLKKKEA